MGRLSDIPETEKKGQRCSFCYADKATAHHSLNVFCCYDCAINGIPAMVMADALVDDCVPTPHSFEKYRIALRRFERYFWYAVAVAEHRIKRGENGRDS